MRRLRKVSIAVFVAIFAIALVGCKKDEVTGDPNCTNGEGAIVTKTISISSLHSIDLTLSGNVNIFQGETQKVELVGQQNIVDAIKTTVSGGLWSIAFKEGCYNYESLEINITIPDLNKVVLSGSGDITVNNFTDQTGKLDVNISGSGNVFLNRFEGITTLNTAISGSGDVTTNEDIASLETLNVDISGSGNYRGFATETQDCNAAIGGSGSIEMTVAGDLDVNISGSGNVLYKGTPVITQSITGSGTIINAN